MHYLKSEFYDAPSCELPRRHNSVPFYRAKEVQPVVEKMITLGKKGGLYNYRRALAFITKEDVAKKLFDEIAPKYAERNGGYTRVTRTGARRGDAAEMAVIELV